MPESGMQSDIQSAALLSDIQHASKEELQCACKKGYTMDKMPTMRHRELWVHLAF
jgi:hypothetical protein